MAASNSSADAGESVDGLESPFLHLAEEEIIQRVLGEHKPSRNPFVRGLWIVIGSLQLSSQLLASSYRVGQQPLGWYFQPIAMLAQVERCSNGCLPIECLAPDF